MVSGTLALFLIYFALSVFFIIPAYFLISLLHTFVSPVITYILFPKNLKIWSAILDKNNLSDEDYKILATIEKNIGLEKIQKHLQMPSEILAILYPLLLSIFFFCLSISFTAFYAHLFLSSCAMSFFIIFFFELTFKKELNEKRSKIK